MKDIYGIIITLIIFLIIDVPMITVINGSMYKKHFALINGSNPDKPKNQVLLFAFLAYIALAVGVYYFSVKNTVLSPALAGALLGFVMYGVYNFTNIATINLWGLKETIVDTVWGTILCSLVGWITSLILVKLG